MAEDGAGGVAGQIQVGVIGQVDRWGAVRDGLVLDAEGVVVGELVQDLSGELPWISLLSPSAYIIEAHGGPRVTASRLGIPESLVEATDTTVEVVGGQIGGELVVDPVEVEAGIGDAVGDAPDSTAEVGEIGLVLRDRVEAEKDIADITFAGGDGQFGGGRSQGDDPQGGAVATGQSKAIHRFAVAGGSDDVLCQSVHDMTPWKRLRWVA